MSKKIILITIVLIFSLLIICSCDNVENVDGVKEKPSSMFIQIEDISSWRVVYHRDTKVMYVVSDGMYSTGIFTLLVNPDGTPMIYTEEEK